MLAEEQLEEDFPVNTLRQSRSSKSKVAFWLMGLLVIYVVVRGIATAAVRPFLFDEVITVAVASQPSAKAIWDALFRAVDSHPPLFYLIEKVAMSVVSNKQVALRLPSIFALPCTLVCLFAYLRKRNSDFVAFLCTVLMLLTSLFHVYAVDGRAYGMVMACIAFGLLCYQRATSPVWAVMLGLTLMFAELLHYYAIFPMLPFWCAEFVYLLRTRRFRWLVWSAFTMGILPLVIFWPLLSRIRAYYGAHIWTHYGLSSIPTTYGSFFLTGGAFGFAIVAVCVAGVIGARVLAPNEALSNGVERDPVEATLLLALLTLPFPTAIATNLMHGAMLDRYVLASVLGVAIAMGCVLSLARGRVVLLFSLFVFSTIAIHEFSFWRSSRSLRLEDPAPPIEAMIEKAGHDELPVVVSDGVTYLELAYYSIPEWKRKFVFLADSDKAVQYSGTDSIDKNLLILQSYLPMQILPLPDFFATHSAFLFYDSGEGFNWLPGYLPSRAASVQALVIQGNKKVYLVTLKDSANSGQ